MTDVCNCADDITFFAFDINFEISYGKTGTRYKIS